MSLDSHPLDRRDLLKASGAALAAACLAPPALAAPSVAPPGKRKTQRVVVVAFAGGVRTRETLGTPDNVPTLRALAAEGVVYPRARTSNLGHYGAALSMFTGVAEQKGIRENVRGEDATVFEILRKDAGLAAGDVWLATSGGAQQVNYSYGTHREYGARYGASTLDSDGIFNRRFQDLLRSFGTTTEQSAGESAVLARLRGALDRRDAERQAAADAVERYVREELARGTADLTGANASDAKALRCARNLLVLMKPKLVAVVLQDADTAHGSFGGYVEVIRRNDAMLGEIVAAVKADRELAETTAILVCPEFGRDKDLNSRRGLDHGDGSDDLAYVSCIAWGPDFRRGAVVNEDVRVIDVAPTVCDLFGARARSSAAKKLPGLYA